MFGLTGEELFGIVWFGIFIAAFLYSLFTRGYLVWFKPGDFIKQDEERKRNSPQWIQFIVLSTTSQQDLWIARTAYIFLLLMILIGLVLFLMQ